MHGTVINPLRADALTAASVGAGDSIRCWDPERVDSERRLTILSTPYLDQDEDLVIKVRFENGREDTVLTSSVGLSGQRFDGTWKIIAVLDN